MDLLLGTLGTVVASLLVLAAASESVLETFRGVLEGLGFKWLKSGMSLDDAVKEAKEFLPKGSPEAQKILAIETLGKTYTNQVADKIAKLDDVKKKLLVVAGDPPSLIDLGKIATDVKDVLDKRETVRVLILRVLVTVIAFVIAWNTKFDALSLVYSIFDQTKQAGDPVATHGGTIFGYLVTAIAAGSGSGYWHDQLDLLRKLKSADQSLKALVVNNT